jgi:hypothetical protein
MAGNPALWADVDRPMQKFVAYIRLSKDPSKTDDRRRYEGLGVEAQRQAIDSHIARVGGRLVGDPLVEFESGKKNNRPQLTAALQRCRLYGATLIVGRMDRLARERGFRQRVDGVWRGVRGVRFPAREQAHDPHFGCDGRARRGTQRARCRHQFRGEMAP